MWLRDALLKSGAVSKKQVKGAERRLKQERKKRQASKKKAKQAAQQAAAEAAKAKQAALDARLQERIALARIERAAAQRLRLIHLLQGGHLRLSGGPARFFFVGRDDKTVERLWVPWAVAQGLRAGALAIASLEQRHMPATYVVIERALAEQVLSLHPPAIRFFNATPPQAEDPALGLLDDWIGAKPKH